MPAPLVGAGIRIGGQIVKAAFGKEAAKKAVAVSTKNAAKKKEAKDAVKAAAKKKPLAEPKSAVRVKPAAKQRPGKKDIMTVIRKRAIRNEQISANNKPGFSKGKTKLIRQVKASNKSK